MVAVFIIGGLTQYINELGLLADRWVAPLLPSGTSTVTDSYRANLNHFAKSVIDVNLKHCNLSKYNQAHMKKPRILNFLSWNYLLGSSDAVSLSMDVPVCSAIGSTNDFRYKTLHICSMLQGQNLMAVFPHKV